MDPPDPENWQKNLAADLADIARWHMPFGKYGPQQYPPDGMPLYDLPPDYLMWFRHNGFPKGRLGRLLAVVCEIHMSGAEAVFEPIRARAGGRRPIRKPRRRNYDFTGGENDRPP